MNGWRRAQLPVAQHISTAWANTIFGCHASVLHSLETYATRTMKKARPKTGSRHLIIVDNSCIKKSPSTDTKAVTFFIKYLSKCLPHLSLRPWRNEYQCMETLNTKATRHHPHASFSKRPSKKETPELLLFVILFPLPPSPSEAFFYIKEVLQKIITRLLKGHPSFAICSFDFRLGKEFRDHKGKYAAILSKDLIFKLIQFLLDSIIFTLKKNC